MKITLTLILPLSTIASSLRGRILSLFDESPPHRKRSPGQPAEIESFEFTYLELNEPPDVSDLKDTRIIGGDEAPSTRYPYAVSIQDDVGHFCGGSLIAPDMVLTAAHCQGGNYNIVIGRYDLSSRTGESIPMQSETIHPDYNDDNTDSDWNLIKLARATKLTVPFVKLNTDGMVPSVGGQVTVMGWGDTTSDDATQELATKLLSVDVTVISNEDCDDSAGTIDGWSNSYKGQITDNMLCARDDGEDACQGDSGGPLVVSVPGGDVQVGVVSWGIGCASKDFPGVYARVSEAYEWIREEICKQSASPPAVYNCGGGGPVIPTSVGSPTTKPTVATTDDDSVDDTATMDDDMDDYSYDDGTKDQDDGVSPTPSPTVTITTDDDMTDDETADDFTTTDDDMTDDTTPTTSLFPTFAPSLSPTLSPIPPTGTAPTDDPAKNWTTILQEDFTTDFGFFTQGGPDAKWLPTKKDRTGIINLQDGNDDTSSIHSNTITDTDYTAMRVLFSVYLLRVEEDDSFCFDVSRDGGVNWIETKCWSSPKDMPSKVWMDDASAEFDPRNSQDLRVRFRGAGNDNQDDVLIDKVAIQGLL